MTPHLNFLIIINIFIATPLCHAMKNDIVIANPDILTNIIVIKEPRQALYLTETHVLINGKKSCAIVDTNINQEVKRIFDTTFPYASSIAADPNKKKFAFSTHYPPDYDQRLTIYDATTYIPEQTLKCDASSIVSLDFSPLNDTIAICGLNPNNYDVALYNYKTNNINTIDITQARNEQQRYFRPNNPIISLHRTQPLMSLAWINTYIFNLETPETTNITNLNGNPYSGLYHDYCQYSPDGSFIARSRFDNKIIITDLKSLTHKYLQKSQSKTLTSMTIHPNSKVLITTSIQDKITTLDYWDVAMAQLITTMILPPGMPCTCTTISVSPSGTKLLLPLYEKCIELAIPFEILYKNITKEKCVAAHLVLQHYLYDNKNNLPQDIRYLLIKTLLEACKR